MLHCFQAPDSTAAVSAVWNYIRMQLAVGLLQHWGRLDDSSQVITLAVRSAHTGNKCTVHNTAAPRPMLVRRKQQMAPEAHLGSNEAVQRAEVSRYRSQAACASRTSFTCRVCSTI